MSTKDISDACGAIRDAWDNIKSDFYAVMPGHYLEIDTVYRSPEEQFELFKKGRAQHVPNGTWVIENKDEVVTNVDGQLNVGAHNYRPSRAIDVCVIDNQTGKRLWKEEWYKPLIEIAARYGLVDGGSWRSIKDFPHLEVKDFKNHTGE